jgi:hypothetical protein
MPVFGKYLAKVPFLSPRPRQWGEGQGEGIPPLPDPPLRGGEGAKSTASRWPTARLDTTREEFCPALSGSGVPQLNPKGQRRDASATLDAAPPWSFHESGLPIRSPVVDGLTLTGLTALAPKSHREGGAPRRPNFKYP